MTTETVEATSNCEPFLLTVEQIKEKQQVSVHNSVLEKSTQLKKKRLYTQCTSGGLFDNRSTEMNEEPRNTYV